MPVSVYYGDGTSPYHSVATDAGGRYDFTSTDAGRLLNSNCPGGGCTGVAEGVVAIDPGNYWGLRVDAEFVYGAGSRWYIAVAGTGGGPDAPNAKPVAVRSSRLTNRALSASPCKLLPLPPITDPLAQAFEAANGNIVDMANLTAPMQTAWSCFTAAVGAAGGSVTPTSAFRPPAYQAHLRQMWERWAQIGKLTAAEKAVCTDLIAAVTSEWNTHDLAYPPAPNSQHPRGRAVDANVAVPGADRDVLAAGCGLVRPLPGPPPAGDPNHYVLANQYWLNSVESP